MLKGSIPAGLIARIAFSAVVFCAAVFGQAASARGELIQVNFAGYALGTDVSNIAEGLSLRMMTNTPGALRTNVYSAPRIASTFYGVGLFTGNFPEYYDCQGGSLDCLEGYAILELQFDTPTDFVEIVSYYESDFAGMVAFDEAGNSLTGSSGWCSFYPHTIAGCATENAVVELPGYGTLNQQTLSLTTENRAISRVLVAGLLGVSTVREITYGVPEPTTLGLTILGMLGARLSCRRRRSR